jgi:hypothetical protein
MRNAIGRVVIGIFGIALAMGGCDRKPAKDDAPPKAAASAQPAAPAVKLPDSHPAIAK